MSTSENNSDASKAQLLIRNQNMRLTTLALLSSSLVACVAPVGGDGPGRPTGACADKPEESLDTVTDNVTIRTDADWDELPTGCWTMRGTLSLQGDKITSLANLDKLTGIDHLELLDTNLTAIDQPLYVYETVSISGNAKLASLENLTIDKNEAVGIEIDDNAALVDLGELTSLIKVTGDLTISRNAKLPKVALRQLAEISGSTRIANNGALTELDFSKLAKLGRFEVLDNGALTAIGSFPARQIDGDLTFRNNAKLSSLGSMGSLETITGRLTIDNNAALTSVGMFTSAMRFINLGLTVSNNAKLTNLGQLSHLQLINGATVTSNGLLGFCAAQEINHCVPQHGVVTNTGNGSTNTNCNCWCE
jgi:hypothetical protein